MTRFSIPRLALAFCAVLLLAASPVQTQRGQQFRGCSLSGDNELPGTPLPGNTGLPLDNALLEDAAELSKLFVIYPAIFYLQETESPNAFAVWKIMPDLLAAEGRNTNCCPDGTVLIGIELIKSEWRATGGSGFSIPAILAHEFAHIAQFKYGCGFQGKWRELHADYLAGWFTGHRSRFRSQNAFQAMKNFYYKGAIMVITIRRIMERPRSVNWPFAPGTISTPVTILPTVGKPTSPA